MAEIRNWNPPKITHSQATYSWGNEEVDYAVDVYFGQQYVGGGRGIDRPWVDVTLGQVNLPALFAANFSGDIGKAFEKTAEDLGDQFKDAIDNYSWGIQSDNRKVFRDLPTWDTITDSGALRDSQQLEVS